MAKGNRQRIDTLIDALVSMQQNVLGGLGLMGRQK